MIRVVFQKAKTIIFPNIHKPLGRWSIDKCDTSVSVVNYYANIDHCGSCDYQKEIIEKIMKSKVMEEKDKTLSS